MLGDDVQLLMELYPRIFHACHSRHVRDPLTLEKVSARQAGILDHLDDTTPTMLSRLAAHNGVTASTMSLAIDRLERMGYVRRERDATDGRRVGITLTESGARLRDAQSILEPDRVRAMLAHLSAEDRSRALEGLATLSRAAEDEMARASGMGSHPK
jgi:DNA-binding MarR family transcriptional regulator